MSTRNDEFLTLLRKSNIITPSKLDVWLNQYDCDDAKKLAVRLIDAGFLTKWQAKYLLSGKYRLRFGSYVLLERISREVIGDRFVGIHEQLNRKVDILFLSPEFSKQSMRLSELIRQVVDAADIDHPNLEHVYDIDQKENRYFLVTEHICGLPMDEICRTRQMNSLQLATIIRQAVDALSFAHQHGVTHGGLAESDMILDADQQLKIRNIFVAFLTRNISQDSAVSTTTPSDDWQAVSRIANAMLEELPLKSAVGDCGTLVKLFATIGNRDFEPTVMSQALSDWIIENDPQHVKKSPGDQDVKAESGPEDLISKETTVTQQNSKQQASSTGTVVGKTNRSGLHSKTPWLVAAIAAGVLLIGGILYLSGVFSSRNNENITIVDTWDAPKPPPIVRPTRVQSRTSVGKGINRVEPNKASSDRSNDLNDDLNDDPNDKTSDESRDEPVAAVNDESAKEPASPPIQAIETEPSNVVAQEIAATGEQPSEVSVASTAENDTNKVAPTETALTNPADDLPSQSPPLKTEKLPFVDLAEAVDIPLASDASEKSLGSVYGFRNHLMLAQLVWNKDLARGRVLFELKRTVTDKQRWDVLYKKRVEDEGTAIAQFARSDDQLLFVWLAAAAENECSDYLRNAILSLEFPGHQKKLNLRKPVLIEGFQLSAETPEVQSEAAVAWLPKNILATVGGLDPDKYGILYFEPESETFDRRHDLRILFDIVDQDQMVSFLLKSDIRKNIRLTAQLQLHLAPGVRPEIATLKRMAEARDVLAQYAKLKTQEYTDFDSMNTDQVREHFRDMNITFEQKTEFVKQRKEEMDLAKNRVEIFNGYTDRLNKFFAEPLPVVLYYELDGEKVVVATTTSPDGVNVPDAMPEE